MAHGQSAPPLIVKATDAKGATVLGELKAENGDSLELLELKTGKKATFQKSALNDLRRGISEKEAASTIGLSEFLVWKIRRVIPGSTASGKVAQLDATAIYVTLGAQSGLRKGQELIVTRGSTEIKDPDDTAKRIVLPGRRIARLVIIEVLENVSKARLAGDLDLELKIGDIVEPASPAQAIAILPMVDLQGAVRAGGKKLSEDLTTGLTQGGIAVVERAMLSKVLTELGLQDTKVFDAEKAQKIGKQLGAFAILLGTLSPNSYGSEANLRLVRVETGEILFATRQDGPGVGGIVEPGFDLVPVVPNSTSDTGSVPITPAVPNNPTPPAAQGWKSLFNGKDLTGWDADPLYWSIRNGVIVGKGKLIRTQLQRSSFMVWKGGSPGDFELRLRARVVAGNSGIQFRSQMAGQIVNLPIVHGYQMEIVNSNPEANKPPLGALSDEGLKHGQGTVMAACGERVVLDASGRKQVVGGTATSFIQLRNGFRDNGWNDYTILAQGPRVMLRINGLLTVDLTDNDATRRFLSGLIALQCHLGNGGTEVEFRDIWLRELKPN